MGLENGYFTLENGYDDDDDNDDYYCHGLHCHQYNHR
jgi:hypothetical protein